MKKNHLLFFILSPSVINAQDLKSAEHEVEAIASDNADEIATFMSFLNINGITDNGIINTQN